MVVTGGAGFLGGAVNSRLEELEADVRIVRSADHDLRQPGATRAALDGAEVVIHLAARVGGIGFNRRNPAPLVYDNLMMAGNVFEQSRLAGVRKLVSACTVCAYPKFTPVPFSEDELWNGYPEESNAPYGLAKKMMLVLSDAYRRQYGFDSCAPIVANLYGPDDNFDLEDSHVIAAMIRKFVEAVDSGRREVVLWGTGKPSREFLYVDDAARALLLAAEHLDSSDAGERGHGAGDSDRRPRRDAPARSPGTRARSSGTRQAPTDSPLATSTCGGPGSSWASRPRCRSRRAYAGRWRAFARRWPLRSSGG